MPRNIVSFVKKHRSGLLAVLLIALLAVILTGASARTDRYVIHARYDAQAHTLHVTQSIHMTNRTGQVLEHLCLNLPANAYTSAFTAPVPRSEGELAYPAGFDAGGMTITQLRIAGQDAAYHLEGEQQTLLCAALPFALRKNGSITLEMEYTLTLPQNRLRMGYSAQDVRLGNAFATLALHDGQDFYRDGYAPIGDPFLTDCADWEVTLTAPPEYTAAGAGLVSTQDGIWRYHLRRARDFALFLSPDWHIAQTEHNGITLRSYAFDENGAQAALQQAAQALDVFTQLFGEYPYKDFTVCAGDFYTGGMEYPGLALIDRSLYESDDGLLEFVVAHEAAHQWWYAAVGSDQIRHPWQDEALAEYATLLYYESHYGAQSFDSLYQAMIRPATETEALRGVGIDQPLDKFESSALYDALIYRKGAAMLHDVRVHMGNDAFIAALRRYYENNRHRVAAPDALQAALGEAGAALLNAWLRGEAP